MMGVRPPLDPCLPAMPEEVARYTPKQGARIFRHCTVVWTVIDQDTGAVLKLDTRSAFINRSDMLERTETEIAMRLALNHLEAIETKRPTVPGVSLRRTAIGALRRALGLPGVPA